MILKIWFGPDQGLIRGRVKGGDDSEGFGDTENLNDKGDDGGALGGSGGGSPNNSYVVPDCHANDEPVSTQALSHTQVHSTSPSAPITRNDKGGGDGALGGSGGSTPNNNFASHDWHANTQVPSTPPKCPHHEVFQPKPRHTPKSLQDILLSLTILKI
ncbi:hypothetical protein H5410_044609 [Solanum commersonii]|uniref:Uncharacterized protein n=1 Tax=Solanum commersonii TaxID=4109 RepID=A0A9J5X926_SOLCO|nr:hypothetical protein H5410_044609 [Solanum commersonii]